MTAIHQVFEQLKRTNRAALIPYFTAGYPSLAQTAEFVRAAATAGADLIELGFPFSDPMADGPAIQKASEIALNNGVNSDDIFELAATLAREGAPPLVAMTYYNLIYRYGLDRFAARAAEGFRGVIVPDLPPEEGTDWQAAAKKHGLDVIYLLAPTSTIDRMNKVSEVSTGFIYCVSLTGVTGARDALSKMLPDFITEVRRCTKKPLAVGFGISTPEQAREVAKMADGVIIGSALVNIVSKAPKTEAFKEVEEFLRQLRSALVR